MSIDPYMRGRMRGENAYDAAWDVGEPMRARCVGEVVESNDEGFEAGDVVLGNLYWAEYATIDGDDLEQIELPDVPDSTALHVLGVSGRTAYQGIVEVGHVKPGDTVVVSAAAGAVGSVAGQIARIAGAQVVGIAGSDEKCSWLESELGFDRALNYRTAENLSETVEDACPQGVDLYFENVGGNVSDAVMDHLNDYSRVAVCGKISLYNREDTDERLRGPRRMTQRTRTRIEGFVASDRDHLDEQITERLSRWVRDDDLRYRETVADGIEVAPEAFLGLFEGDNLGKQLVNIEGGRG
jgi:NADPH-dependent curcumin reductase CurA